MKVCRQIFYWEYPKGECNRYRRTSNLNLQKGVRTVGSPEEPVHLTPTYDRIFGGGNGSRTEVIQKRQVISEEEEFGVSLKVVGREFSLHIQLGITEDNQVKTSIRSRMPRDIIRRYGNGSTRISERIILLQGIPVIQMRLNFVECFTRI